MCRSPSTLMLLFPRHCYPNGKGQGEKSSLCLTCVPKAISYVKALNDICQLSVVAKT